MAQSCGIRTVFISSTHLDLVDYRLAARDAVLGFDAYPLMMEYWPSMDQSAVELSLSQVDRAEVFIGIYAHKYGYCPTNGDTSITEMEFDRATGNGIPRLCFLVDESMPWPLCHVEGEPGMSRLRKFKDVKINSALVRRIFTTPDRLEIEILKALRPVLEPSQRQHMVFDITAPVLIKSTESGLTPPQAKVVVFLQDKAEHVDDVSLVRAVSTLVGVKENAIKIMQRAENSTVQLEIPESVAPDLRRLVATFTDKPTTEKDRVFLWSTLIENGTLTVPFLLEALQQRRDSETQCRIISALWTINDKRAVDPLMVCLRDRREKVRAFATCGLGWLQDERAIPALVDMLNDPKLRVQWFAAIALKRFGNIVVDTLQSALQDPRERVQIGATNILGWIVVQP